MVAGQHAAEFCLTQTGLEAVQAAGADEVATLPQDQSPFQGFPYSQQTFDACQHLRNGSKFRKRRLPDEAHHPGIPVDGEQISTVLHAERAQQQPGGQQNGQVTGQG